MVYCRAMNDIMQVLNLLQYANERFQHFSALCVCSSSPKSIILLITPVVANKRRE
jgi:hypothetical protein